MDALAFTYDPSFDAWVLELKPISLHNTNKTSSSKKKLIAFASSKTKASAATPDHDEGSQRRLVKFWQVIKDKLAECWVCHRECIIIYGDGSPREKKMRNKPAKQSENGYYSQMSIRDRDEKLSEAIVYCKNNMRRDSGCHQPGCLPRRSYRSSTT